MFREKILLSSEAYRYDRSMALASRLIPDTVAMRPEVFRAIGRRAYKEDSQASNPPAASHAICWHMTRTHDAGSGPLEQAFESTAPATGMVAGNTWWYALLAHAVDDGYVLGLGPLSARAVAQKLVASHPSAQMPDFSVPHTEALVTALSHTYKEQAPSAMYEIVKRLVGLDAWLSFALGVLTQDDRSLLLAIMMKAPVSRQDVATRLLTPDPDWDCALWWRQLSNWMCRSGSVFSGTPRPAVKAPACIRALWLGSIVQRARQIPGHTIRELPEVKSALAVRGWFDADVATWLSQWPAVAVRKTMILDLSDAIVPVRPRIKRTPAPANSH